MALFSVDKETHLEEWGTCHPGYQLDPPTVIAGDNMTNEPCDIFGIKQMTKNSV